ncbi:MAG: hypothetical protein M1531_05980, partial [Chloroflexi bacterium]|nr:hypothetical protein [Chloroflexota bacterium]
NGKYSHGYGWLLVELGRPGIGARFRDLERITLAMATQGFPVEPGKTTGLMMADMATGRLKGDVRDEKASRINVEFKVPLGQVPAVVEILQRVAPELDTVVSVGIMRRFAPDGGLPDLGVPAYPNGKINVGLGRPRAEG